MALRKLNIKTRLLPPLWLMCPHISQFSIGWRMGWGEDYRYDFQAWFNGLTSEEKAEYRGMFPAPKTWRGYYDEDAEACEILDSQRNSTKGLSDSTAYRYKYILLWNKDGEMEYSREKLVDLCGSNKTVEFMFFWQPQAGADNESCLGQWQPAEFTVDTDRYCYAEQYMMAEKARLFKDEATRHAIMQADNPKTMKALGRTVRGFDQAVWDRAKYAIALNGNYHKFSQNEDMRNYVLSTGTKVLVEASPLDTIWGIGLGAEDACAAQPALWRGENLLGFALMEVRDELRRVYQNYHAIPWDEINHIFGDD